MNAHTSACEHAHLSQLPSSEDDQQPDNSDHNARGQNLHVKRRYQHPLIPTLDIIRQQAKGPGERGGGGHSQVRPFVCGRGEDPDVT